MSTDGLILTDFPVGYFALIKYAVRDPSKLHCCWEGSVEVMSRERNIVTVQVLKTDKLHECGVSRLWPMVKIKVWVCCEARDQSGRLEGNNGAPFLPWSVMP